MIHTLNYYTLKSRDEEKYDYVLKCGICLLDKLTFCCLYFIDYVGGIKIGISTRFIFIWVKFNRIVRSIKALFRSQLWFLASRIFSSIYKQFAKIYAAKFVVFQLINLKLSNISLIINYTLLFDYYNKYIIYVLYTFISQNKEYHYY